MDNHPLLAGIMSDDPRDLRVADQPLEVEPVDWVDDDMGQDRVTAW
jgi:hypothetical protein